MIPPTCRHGPHLAVWLSQRALLRDCLSHPVGPVMVVLHPDVDRCAADLPFSIPPPGGTLPF